RPTPETGALFHYLNTSKRSAALDATEVTELTAGWADLVVTAEDSPVETDGCVVSISPYGRRGPLVGTPWTELTLQGWCGAISARGSPDRPPVQLGGRVGEWLGGAAAAMAGVAGILHRDASGTEI